MIYHLAMIFVPDLFEMGFPRQRYYGGTIRDDGQIVIPREGQKIWNKIG